MQRLMYQDREYKGPDTTTALLNNQDNDQAVQNPYTVFVQQDGMTVNWVAYTMGKVNNVVWGSMTKGIVHPDYGCKQVKGLKILNDIIKELKDNDYFLAGSIARNRAGALINYHMNGQEIHASGQLDVFIEDVMREMGIISETPSVIERAYELWFYENNPDDRNVYRENIRGLQPLLQYIMHTHIDSQRFPHECPTLETCQNAWDQVCGLYGVRSIM